MAIKRISSSRCSRVRSTLGSRNSAKYFRGLSVPLSHPTQPNSHIAIKMRLPCRCRRQRSYDNAENARQSYVRVARRTPPSRSEDLQRGDVVSVTVRLDDDLHILIESHEEPQKALNGKLPELTAQHLGYIWLTDAKQIGSLHLFQTAILHDRVDLEYKLRLDQMLLRIRHTDVLEHIAASGFVSLLVGHGCISLAICSASRSRCLISSMSRRGVSRPVFDFFWKA